MATTHLQNRTLDELRLRSKEFNVMFHGIQSVDKRETVVHLEYLVRTFLTDKLHFSPDHL